MVEDDRGSSRLRGGVEVGGGQRGSTPFNIKGLVLGLLYLGLG